MGQDTYIHKSKLPGKAAAFPDNIHPRRNNSTTKSVQDVASQHAGQYKSRLAQLQEELDLLTSYGGDMVYRLRYQDMKYDYISPAVTGLLGFSVEEMKKINFRSLIVETKLVTDGMKMVQSFDELEAMRKQGDVNKWQADYLIRTKDGSKIWVSDISHPWFDDNGNVVGSIGSLRDITDRVIAEEQTRQELDRIANTDALTSIPNRREFFHELNRELKRIHRSGEDVSILLVDVDNFKQINQDHGRDVGDKVLIEITQVIHGCLRETDMQARIGGEEFGIILTGAASQGATWVAERLRHAIVHHEFSIGLDKATVACTISVGIASAAPGEEKDSSELYKLADTRLYIAKNTGHNQVSVDDVRVTH